MPGNAAYLTRSNAISFNFSGTRDWSDGATTACWSASRRRLVRCGFCKALFWIEDVPSLGVRERRPRPFRGVECIWAGCRGDQDGLLHEEQRWQHVPQGWDTAEGGCYSVVSQYSQKLAWWMSSCKRGLKRGLQNLCCIFSIFLCWASIRATLAKRFYFYNCLF